MKQARYYIAPVISIIALVAYFSPWYGDPHKCLAFYIFAVLWFFVAWFAIPFNFTCMILCLRKHDKSWKHHLIAATLIIICYIGLFIGIANSFIVTV
jgi:hypothetical protein